MALTRDRPYGNSNFLVTVGTGNSRTLSAGFAEVIFPPFTVPGQDAACGEPGMGEPGNRLILRRGLIGTLDLYAWWHKARLGKAPQRRSVKVELLAEDQATVVVTWRFRNVRPVCLSYSPLRALEGGIVMETLELAFERMDMS
jgi:hypothetical protein